MIDNVINFLDNSWLYLLLFVFICVFISREILIKKLERLVADQRQLIIGQEKLIIDQEKLIIDLNKYQSQNILLKNKNNDIFLKINSDEQFADKQFSGGLEVSPKPNPKPNPKKQAKPKKKRK